MFASLIVITLLQALVSFAYLYLSQKKRDYDSKLSSLRRESQKDEDQIKRCIQGHQKYREMISHLVDLETIDDPMKNL